MAYMFIWYQGSYAALNNQTAYLKAALNNKALLYGTLRTVDTSTMTLTIDTVNNYQAGGDPIVYTFPLLSGIFIVQQELVIKDGVYVSASSTPGALRDLQPGTRVKFLITSHNGESGIGYLIYGNPL